MTQDEASWHTAQELLSHQESVAVAVAVAVAEAGPFTDMPAEPAALTPRRLTGNTALDAVAHLQEVRTRSPAVVGTFVALAGAVSVLPLYALPRPAATATAWVLHIGALLCALVLLLRGVGTDGVAMRLPRQLLAAALGANVVGGLLAIGYVAIDGQLPVPSLVDPVTLLWVPLATYGFWRIPRRPAARVRASRLAADAAVAGTALLFVSWVAVIEPLIASGRWNALGLAAQVAYPVCDVAIAAVVISLLPRARADLRRMLNLATAGLLLIAISDSGFAARLASEGSPGFGWPDVVLQAGMCLYAYAALVRPVAVIRGEAPVPSLDRHLVYIPVVFASAAGLLHVALTGALDLDDALFGALMLAALLIRQGLFARDISAISDEHQHAAGHDTLTGLANRKRFFSHFEEHLTTPGTGDAWVLLLDLDGFKEVNDTFGHDAGDQVLVGFAQALREAAPGSLVARLGGDEFAVLLVGPTAQQDAVAVAALLTADADQRPTQVGCSIGVAPARAGDTAADALHRADLAMYAAKQAPGCRVALFTEALAQQAERRHLLTSDLAGAVKRGEMHLLYQPLYRLSDGALAGVEALLRWTHPLFGPVGPDEFIPIAEDAGHIDAIGRWVLEQAVAQTVAWQEAGRYLPRLFVNVSAGQFTNAFPTQVTDVLTQHGVAPERLTLEITESQLPGLAVSETMAALRRSGVQIALDDFGAGYSSLAQLARLPVDVLKIDRDFIRNLGETAGRPVMDAVINLAKALGLSTVAEGIEDLTQAAEANNAGVEYGQGYLFSRPESVADVERRLPTMVPPARTPSPGQDTGAPAELVPRSSRPPVG